MELKKVRNIKVISQSGRNYKPTPTVILKGQWLNEMGFEIGDQIKVVTMPPLAVQMMMKAGVFLLSVPISCKL